MTVRPTRAASSTSSDGLERPSEAVVWRCRSVRAVASGLSPTSACVGARCGRCRRHARSPTRTTLALDERLVFANQQIEVIALFVGELEENLLAFRVLEFLAVLLEEAMRAALTADADHERLLIVHAASKPLGAFGEETICRPLEEEERRARLELRITLQQLRVSRLELAEMLFLFEREILKDLAAARVARQTRCARVELESAALGRDRDA